MGTSFGEFLASGLDIQSDCQCTALPGYHVHPISVDPLVSSSPSTLYHDLRRVPYRAPEYGERVLKGLHFHEFIFFFLQPRSLPFHAPLLFAMAYKLLLLAALLPAALAGPAQDKKTCKPNDKCLSALSNPRRIEIAQAFCNVFTDVPCKNSRVIPKFALEGCNGKDIIAAVSSACACLPTTPVTSSATCVASTATIVNTQTIWSTSTQTSVQTISNTIYSTDTVSNTETVYITVPQTITATATETTTYSETFDAPNTFIVSTTSKTASTSAATPTLAALPKTCSNTQVSCQNTTAVADLCCLNAPGGQLLLTQFWDTAPSTGPADSWTLHGLWYFFPRPITISQRKMLISTNQARPLRRYIRC
jgi:hypothetical protein